MRPFLKALYVCGAVIAVFLTPFLVQSAPPLELPSTFEQSFRLLHCFSLTGIWTLLNILLIS